MSLTVRLCTDLFLFYKLLINFQRVPASPKTIAEIPLPVSLWERKSAARNLPEIDPSCPCKSDAAGSAWCRTDNGETMGCV